MQAAGEIVYVGCVGERGLQGCMGPTKLRLRLASSPSSIQLVLPLSLHPRSSAASDVNVCPFSCVYGNRRPAACVATRPCTAHTPSLPLSRAGLLPPPPPVPPCCLA